MNKKLRDRLDKLEDLLKQTIGFLEGEYRAVTSLERRNTELEKQNKELFDRLMARDLETYATYNLQRASEGLEAENKASLAPEEDEDNAGLVLAVSAHTKEG